MNPFNHEEQSDNNSIRGLVEETDPNNKQPLKSKRIYVTASFVRYAKQKVKIKTLMNQIANQTEHISNEFTEEKNVAHIVQTLTDSKLINSKNSRYGSKGF